MSTWERRDSVPRPLPALRYARRQRDGLAIYIGAFGSIVVVQTIGSAPDESSARALFDSDAAFDPAYRQAVAAVRSLTTQAFDDFDSSTLWFEGEATSPVHWNLIQLPYNPESVAVLVEAMMIYQLTELTAAAIAELPDLRRRGRINPALSSYTESLFAAREPHSYLVSGEEISLMERFYEGWHLRTSIDQLQQRFEQATSSHAFVWEHAERRRDVVMNMLLAVVAVVGLLQADKSLATITGLTATAVDYAILGIAAAIGVAVVYRLFLSDPIRRRLRRRAARRVERWLRQP